MANESSTGASSPTDGESTASREEHELPSSGGPSSIEPPFRTPLFHAHHSERYARQELIGNYEKLTGANLIAVIDQIFPDNMTYLEELLGECDSSKPLHVLLASPGGDGETAIRMTRSMQTRCTELTIVLPDMAKSAATLICLGADTILMGPGGDLGPVDPQFQVGTGLVGAKEIVRAVDEAEERITNNPATFPLFASLLADVNMLKVEQARSAMERTEALVREALSCTASRSQETVNSLAQSLQAPLIDDPASHSAVISADAAARFGLPVQLADTQSATWRLIWMLWTRYFTLGCFPAGSTAIYEGRRASNVITAAS